MSVISCQWITVCLREGERRRCVYHPVSMSPCQQLPACVRRPRFSLRYFSTSDSSRPTPEVGGGHSFPPTENLKYPDSGEGVRVELGICPHVTVLCACVFAWVSLCPVHLCVEVDLWSDCDWHLNCVDFAIPFYGHRDRKRTDKEKQRAGERLRQRGSEMET